MRKLTGKTNEYSALITFLRGCKDKFVDHNGKQIQWAGAEYKMLMYLPVSEKWCLSAYYSPDDKLTFWYFDISRNNFVDERGMPCTDDVFLDLVIFPSGEKITLDEDELQEAFDKGIVSKEDVDNAYAVHDQIKNSKWSNVDFLKKKKKKLLLEHDLGDIPDFQNFAQIEPITKGWSEYKKYCVTKANGIKHLRQWTDGISYKLKEAFDFSLLGKYGKVFKVLSNS
jgi:predicted RNA-binding protein associated with RNAse of E/G family